MPAKDSQALVFGKLLGYGPGGVAAYSSDYDTASDEEYPNRSSYRSYLDGIYMGYKWQCVEFARRWMYINKGYIFDDVVMAFDIFELRSVRDVKANTRLPFQAFTNGSRTHPELGSLLIWEEGGEFEDTGHVAVITEVTSSYIRIAEQNVGHKAWADGQDYARQLKAKVTDDNGFWIECSYSDGKILGWMTQTDCTLDAEPMPSHDVALSNVKPLQVEVSSPERKVWLNIANEDEAAFVDMMGGHFLSDKPNDQYLYYGLSKSAKDDLEYATNELHGLFMHATDYVLSHPDLLEKFNLPSSVLPKIRQSWENRLNQLITSRFDFSMSEKGLKVYEYNCDSASCYMEAGKIQGKWAEHFHLKDGEDAGKDLFSELVRAWRKSHAKGLVHILRDDEPEEKYHALFMQQALKRAGIETKIIIGLDGLSWDRSGNITDEDGNQVQWVWKTWSWETALDQIRAECDEDEEQRAVYEPRWKVGKALRLSDVLFREKVMVFEPLWTLIPSNKAILPVLWSLFPNHPLLLNSSFELTEDLKSTGYVKKPIVGRCGSNISLIDQHDNIVEKTVGQFSEQNVIYQELFPLPKIGDHFVQICTFSAAGIYAGAGTRVDQSMVINNKSDCLALRFYDDSVFKTL
jgi:glutathionylspermidine amidase/synthetase